MTSATFETIIEAIAYGRDNGGWIWHGNDGTVQWFDAGKWTPTPIVKAVRGAGFLGTWSFHAERSTAAVPVPVQWYA